MSNTDKNKAISAPVVTPAAPASAKPLTTNGAPVSVNGVQELVPASTSPASIPSSEIAADEGDEKDKIQYFIIEGEVDTFPDVSKAEKFLNSPDAPVCTVIYGKISLVNEWHITTGKIHSFKTLVKAQKFLKESTLAPKKFVMVRGRITVPEVRVSLRG